MDKTVKCMNCGNTEGNVMQVPMLVSMDAEALYGIRKSDFAKASTQIWAAYWDRSTVICPKCGHNSHQRLKDTPSEDSILEGMRTIAADYEGHATFKVLDKDYSPEQMVKHLTINSDVGREFRKNMNQSIMMFLMSFGGKD